jgi:hypothetical protein
MHRSPHLQWLLQQQRRLLSIMMMQHSSRQQQLVVLAAVAFLVASWAAEGAANLRMLGLPLEIRW